MHGIYQWLQASSLVLWIVIFSVVLTVHLADQRFQASSLVLWIVIFSVLLTVHLAAAYGAEHLKISCSNSLRW